MDPQVFAAMHAALPGSGIHSVVTVKDGVIIDEYYEEGYDAVSYTHLDVYKRQPSRRSPVP